MPRNGGSNAGLVDGAGQKRERRHRCTDVAVKPGEFPIKLGQAGGAVAIFSALVAFQAADGQTQGVSRGPALIGLSLGIQLIEL